MPYEFSGGSALLVATPSPLNPYFTYGVRSDTRSTVWQGYVDNVRVSDIVRYDVPGEVPPRELQADQHTIALWEFEKGSPYP